MANANLHKAKNAKNDEFYTQLTDIEKELMHYKEHFKDKVVFCNCDDPKDSAFWKYFDGQFNRLGLKRLIATHYEPGKQSYLLDRTRIGEESPTIIKNLNGDGDFRSEECIELLKQSDIVITNPPFSLFREYIAQLMKYEKKFIIIGNKNAITYKEFFPLLKENKVWIGYNSPCNFSLPDGTITKKMVGLTRWYSNLDIKKRHEQIDLYERYKGNEEHYPKYDNYEAIEVSKVIEIPKDYFGVMGVPITFLDKYCPEQFVILGMESSAGYDYEIVGIPLLVKGDARPTINNKTKYARVFIKRKEQLDEN